LYKKPSFITSLLFAFVTLAGTAQDAATPQPGPPATRPAVHGHRPVNRGTASSNPALCAACVKENLSYLAGPALHGRGSTTEDEHKAAEYIAAQLKSYGLAPAAEHDDYIQVGSMRSREAIGNPTLAIEPQPGTNAKPVVFTHGQQIVVAELSHASIAATMQRIDLSGDTTPPEFTTGAVLLIKLKPGIKTDEARKLLAPYRSGKAAMVIVPSSYASRTMFDRLAKQPPYTQQLIGNEEPGSRAVFILAKEEAFDQLWSQPDGTTVDFEAEISPWKTTNTWNVLAKLQGTTEKDQVILLSAHLDHLGIKDGETYYGADDDASGTAAVMELARVLAKEPKPKRTVVVALWGSEEVGLVGARFFLQNPTFPLHNIVANLEFEMIGRADPKVKPDELWLTGWERTNLGPELAKHGAKLVADSRPDQQFFTRSDNYALAKQGIVAQTVSSFGLHTDYHQPTDTVDKIDFQHMDQAVASIIGPVTWLANTDFTPEWVDGKKP
jgi:aminopeptidase YwaD